MSASDSTKKHVVIVGAGPGGLTSAMLLAHRGFDVTIYEQADQVGGRNGEIQRGDYRFDIGPTFLMMKFLLDEIFEETGRKASDYMEFVPLDPMYELAFKDKSVFPSTDPEKMKAEIERGFPGQGPGFDQFLTGEQVRFSKMYPCLQKDYSNVLSMVRPILLAALPHLSVGNSLYSVLSNYFDAEELRLSFTFQSKYLGMSPWTCPGAFAIIPYIEYAYGIYHVIGGLSEISRQMAKVCAEEGVTIHLNTKVDGVLLDGRTAKGVRLNSGEEVLADEVILNADFAHACNTLFEEGFLKKYTPTDLANRDYSCSTYMLYLGVDKQYDTKVHTIVFAEDYERNLREISQTMVLSEDPSIYVRNATVVDKTLAPEGHSAIYVLVPIANQKSDIDWEKEAPAFRERVLDKIQSRTAMTDIRDHIVEEVQITPADWEDRSIYLGATFNLAHTLGQMLWLRPHNQFEEGSKMYLVGGGTHPGSGLPTIYESGRISANLICDGHDVDYPEQVSFEEHEERLKGDAKAK